MKLNEHSTFWLDGWVNKKTNANEIARGHARAIGLHIAALHAEIEGLRANSPGNPQWCPYCGEPHGCQSAKHSSDNGLEKP